MLALALIENLQRSDLNPVEEAKGYRQLIDASGMTQEALSKAVSKSRSAITNSLRLLDLPEVVQQNMANMKKEYKMSAERKEELQKELTYLKTVREKEVADLIKEARGFGDLSENSEYDEAKNEQGKLYSRIAEVEEILLHTVIVDENDAGTNGISIGCRVTVQDVKSGRELPEYKVVGSQEADPMHRAISEDSPFGKALMGAKEGDEVTVEAPVGAIVYRIVKIER